MRELFTSKLKQVFDRLLTYDFTIEKNIDYDLHEVAGDFFAKQSNNWIAINCYSTSLTKKPKNVELLKRRGQLFLESGEKEQAEKDFLSISIIEKK